MCYSLICYGCVCLWPNRLRDQNSSRSAQTCEYILHLFCMSKKKAEAITISGHLRNVTVVGRESENCSLGSLTSCLHLGLGKMIPKPLRKEGQSMLRTTISSGQTY